MDEKNVPYIILFTSIICIAMQKKVSNVSDNCGHQHVKKKTKKRKKCVISFINLLQDLSWCASKKLISHQQHDLSGPRHPHLF
jgi:hypothetical protein